METSIFTRQIASLMTDEEYAGFQHRLAAQPAARSLIKGGAGIRKIAGSHGKRGGGPVIYYWAVDRSAILLLFAYAKNEAVDLTPSQIRRLAGIVKEEFGK